MENDNSYDKRPIDYIVYFIIKNMDVLSNTICYPSSAFASHSDLLFFCANLVNNLYYLDYYNFIIN